MKFVLGKKIGMTTIQDGELGARNVTLIECPTNTVTFVRSFERDGYAAVQLEISKTTKKTLRHEFRLDRQTEKSVAEEALKEYSLGQTLAVDVLAVGQAGARHVDRRLRKSKAITWLRGGRPNGALRRKLSRGGGRKRLNCRREESQQRGRRGGVMVSRK